MLVQNMVEANGKTVRENNMMCGHNIAIGTLVEIIGDDKYQDEEDQQAGCRLFVVDHTRDCDGAPLYSLSFNKLAAERLADAEMNRNQVQARGEKAVLETMVCWSYRGSIVSGMCEDDLKVVM